MIINEEFKKKEEEIQRKYDRYISDVGYANNVDLRVAYLMLVQNARSRKEGLPLYPGAQFVDYDALEKDLDELDALRRV